jgi:hypothetical protein
MTVGPAVGMDGENDDELQLLASLISKLHGQGGLYSPVGTSFGPGEGRLPSGAAALYRKCCSIFVFGFTRLDSVGSLYDNRMP